MQETRNPLRNAHIRIADIHDGLSLAETDERKGMDKHETYRVLPDVNHPKKTIKRRVYGTKTMEK